MFWKKIFGIKEKRRDKGTTDEMIDSGNLKVVVKSDLGNIRLNNEDLGMFYKIASEDIMREKGCLLMVADGMGGHQAGEVASKMATDIISREYFKDSGYEKIEKTLFLAFKTANCSIYSQAAADKKYFGMGTTCTAVAIINNKIFYAHAGDSRAYLIKQKKIYQVTEDHTYVQQLVSNGTISEKEAATHPERNILTNAMGTKSDLRIDTGIFSEPFEKGDILLLCSDGLYEYIKDDEMVDLLSSNTISEAATVMIEEAKKRGGHDNITIVLAEKKIMGDEPVSKETRDIILPVTKEHNLP